VSPSTTSNIHSLQHPSFVYVLRSKKEIRWIHCLSIFLNLLSFLPPSHPNPSLGSTPHAAQRRGQTRQFPPPPPPAHNSPTEFLFWKNKILKRKGNILNINTINISFQMYPFVLNTHCLRISLCSSILVRALWYKPEGHRFETQWGEFFQFT
jgi:hypothetical protein